MKLMEVEQNQLVKIDGETYKRVWVSRCLQIIGDPEFGDCGVLMLDIETDIISEFDGFTEI